MKLITIKYMETNVHIHKMSTTRRPSSQRQQNSSAMTVPSKQSTHAMAKRFFVSMADDLFQTIKQKIRSDDKARDIVMKVERGSSQSFVEYKKENYDLKDAKKSLKDMDGRSKKTITLVNDFSTLDVFQITRKMSPSKDEIKISNNAKPCMFEMDIKRTHKGTGMAIITFSNDPKDCLMGVLGMCALFESLIGVRLKMIAFMWKGKFSAAQQQMLQAFGDIYKLQYRAQTVPFQMYVLEVPSKNSSESD